MQLATLTVANRSAAALDVTVTPRPWVQAVDGQGVPEPALDAPRRQRQPDEVHAPARRRDEGTATLTSAPSAGYLYGAMEVVGVPTDAATRKGVVLGYRLVGALRVLPAAPKLELTAGNVKASGATAVIPVKNTGNTLDPVTGSVKVKGAAGTKNLTVAGGEDPARQDRQSAGRHEARQGLLHGHGGAQRSAARRRWP